MRQGLLEVVPVDVLGRRTHVEKNDVEELRPIVGNRKEHQPRTDGFP